MQLLRVLAFVSLVTAAAPVPAAYSGTYDFCVSTGGAIDPFCASFGIAFDDSVDVGPTTTGIALLMQPSGFTLGSALGFQFVDANDFLVVGGVANLVNGVALNTNDFFIGISGATTGSPTFAYFSYATAGGDYGENFESAQSLTFTPGDLVIVPEPGSLALLVCALAAACVVRARRRRSSLAT